MAFRKGFENTNSRAQAPTIEEKIGPGGDKETIERHPAYGQICVFKTSGYAALYGSDFAHQNYVTIEISESELHRGLSRDWPHARSPFVRFSMSESQWGHFVSSFSDGAGTQITFAHKPEFETLTFCPAIQLRDSADLYAGEGRERIDRAINEIENLMRDLEANELKGLSKTKQRAVLDKLSAMRNALGPSLQFVADSFGEHLEDRKERAKTEILAWAHNTVSRLGLEALVEKTGLPLQIGHRQHDEAAE